MTRATLWISIAVSIASCEKRDPLYCGLNMGDPRCLDDGGFGGDTAAGFVTIGGTVTGLQGGGLVLQNSGGDDKAITSSGPFRFATAVPMDSAYEVTIGTQPTNPSQTCTVTMGSGTAATDVMDVQVDCTTAAYTVGGTVVGCGASCTGNLVLTDNGGDDLTINANGAFTFATKVPSQSVYAVAIKTNPAGACSVAGGMGLVGNANISSIVVNCTPGTYTLAGTAPNGGVSGLNGTMMLHAVFGGPSAPAASTIAVSTNSFAFPTAIPNMDTWNITVSAQPAYPPAAQNCTITQSAMGTIMGSNITSVTVSCATKQFTIGGMVTGLNPGNSVVLRNNGADNLTVNANGAFTFATPIYSGLTYATTVLTQPVGQFCAVTMGSGTVANGNVTTVRVKCGDPGIKCGAGYCGSAQKCCDPEGGPACVGIMQSCTQLALPCDDAADCGPGNECCAMTHNGNGAVLSVSCAASCTGSNPVQMCDPAASGECSSGTCQAWSNLPGYNACL